MDLNPTFSANPEFSLIITEVGHAYGKAKFSSTCKLTGMPIAAGEAIRRITLVTRTGTEWTGHTANRIFDYLNARSLPCGNFATTISRCSHDWLDRVEAGMASATVGATLRLVDKNGTEKVYRLSVMGKWRSRFNDSTAAQVLSSLKRSRSYRLFSLSNNA